jgi:hypothetical protein
MIVSFVHTLSRNTKWRHLTLHYVKAQHEMA